MGRVGSYSGLRELNREQSVGCCKTERGGVLVHTLGLENIKNVRLSYVATVSSRRLLVRTDQGFRSFFC